MKRKKIIVLLVLSLVLGSFSGNSVIFAANGEKIKEINLNNEYVDKTEGFESISKSGEQQGRQTTANLDVSGNESIPDSKNIENAGIATVNKDTQSSLDSENNSITEQSETEIMKDVIDKDYYEEVEKTEEDYNKNNFSVSGSDVVEIMGFPNLKANIHADQLGFDTYNESIYRAERYLTVDSVSYKNISSMMEIGIPSDIIVNLGKADGGFMGSVAAWKAANMIVSPSQIAEGALDEIGFYEAIIFSIFIEQSKDTNYLYRLVKETNSETNKIIAQVEKWIKETDALDQKVDVRTGRLKSLSEKDKEEMKEKLEIIFIEEHPLLDGVSEIGGMVKTVFDISDTLIDAIETMTAYMQLSELPQEMKSVISYMNEKCPDNNMYLKQALQEASDATKSLASAFSVSVLHTVDDLTVDVAGELIDDWWKSVLSKNKYALAYSSGAKLGIFISNTLFSTDKMIEQFDKMACLQEVYKLLKEVIVSSGEMFEHARTVENADVYIAAVDAMYKAGELSCDFAMNFEEAYYTDTIATLELLWKNDSYENYLQKLRSIKSYLQNNKQILTKSYLDDLEADYPELFEQLYGSYEEKYVAVEGIQFPQDEITIGTLDVYACFENPVISPSNATKQGVTYISSDTSILEISGPVVMLTPHKPGTVTVTVSTDDGGYTDTIVVHVVEGKVADFKDWGVPSVVTLTITADKSTVNPGDTVTFTVSIGPVGELRLGGLEFDLIIPEGLTIIDESVSIPEGLADIFDTDADEIVKPRNGWSRWSHSARKNGYTGTSDFQFLTFSCTVDANIELGEKSLDVNRDTVCCFDNSLELNDYNTVISPASFTVEKAKVPVGLPDSFSQDMVVPPDEYWILVMNETALPIPDAEINIDGEASYIYEDGIIKLKANNKSVWIVADREGKQPYFNYFTLQGGGAGYIKLLDSVPTLTATINNVILEEEQKSLLMNQFILYQGDPSAKPVYTLTIYWDGNEPDVYQLVQNGKVLEESHTNQITVDLMNRLTVDQDGVSVVLKKDGKVLCKKEINLKFRKEPEGKDGSKVEFGSKCKVSIDGTNIPFFDNTDLSFDTLVQLPVRIDVEENKAKIYIGDAYDLMKDGGNTFTYNDFVKKVEKEWRHAQIASTFKGGAVAGFKVFINFVGYGEGEVDPYTGVVQAKVGVYGKITGKNGITWYTFLGPVPFYAKVTGKVEDKISVETTLVIKNGKLLTSSVNMDNNLKLELGLGAGVGLNDLICADVSGKGILEWKTGGTLTTVDKNEITLKAEAAIRVVLLFLTYEKKWPSDSIQLYPITDTGSSWRIRRAKEYSSDIYEESAYQVLPRDYLLDSGARSVSFHSEGSTGAEDAGQVIINGLYPDAKPQLVSDGGKTYLFYLDDIVSRAAEDRTALMYRIQTGDTWSEPVIVQEDGTADFDFEACAGDDGIYIVWQNAIKSMSGITSLQEAASCLTLQTAQIKEDNIVLLGKPDTTVGLMPVSPSLVCHNGNVYICWYENSQNDILQNANGKNVFYTQQMKGNIVGQRTVLGETEMGVTTADFGFYQNALSGAFTGDVDGDMNTVADREVYLLQNGSLQRLTHNDTIDSNPQFGILEGNQVMVYYADGNLVSVDGASARTIFGEADTTLSDDFYFTGEPAQPVIVWKNAYLAGEDAGQALTAVCYEDGEWKGPVEAVRSQDSLVAFSVCGKQSDRGFAQIVYTARGRTDGPEITRLYETEAPKTGNASIAKMTYEEDSFLPGEIFPVEITLINNGVYPIQGVEICVVDETGAEIVRQKSEILLNAGDEGTIALTDFWPDDREDLSEYTLQVYVDGRLCDTHTLTLGGASLSLDSKITYEEEDEILNLNVTNHSGLSADFRLIIQAEGDVLFEKEYTAVPGKSSVNYFCKLDTLWGQTQKDSLSVTVESPSRQEECLLDNEIIIYRPNRTEPITVELEQRELQLQPGESLQLTALFPSYVQNKALIWSSNYSECVEVDSNGVVTAKTDGIAMVTATTCDGYTSSCVITVGEPDVQLFSIAGKIQSHGESQDKAVVRLLRGTDEIFRQETATGEYILTDVEPGSYTLQISKAGHVTREYPVTVQAESVSLDIRIHLIGDVNGDGKVNIMDKRIIFNHIAGTKLTGYEFQVGDVNGDGTINIMDKRMIFNHIAGTGLLW